MTDYLLTKCAFVQAWEEEEKIELVARRAGDLAQW